MFVLFHFICLFFFFIFTTKPLNRKCIIFIFHVDLGFSLDISNMVIHSYLYYTSHFCFHSNTVWEWLSKSERGHLVIILMFRCHNFEWSDRLHAYSLPLSLENSHLFSNLQEKSQAIMRCIIAIFFLKLICDFYSFHLIFYTNYDFEVEFLFFFIQTNKQKHSTQQKKKRTNLFKNKSKRIINSKSKFFFVFRPTSSLPVVAEDDERLTIFLLLLLNTISLSLFLVLLWNAKSF